MAYGAHTSDTDPWPTLNALSARTLTPVLESSKDALWASRMARKTASAITLLLIPGSRQQNSFFNPPQTQRTITNHTLQPSSIKPSSISTPRGAKSPLNVTLMRPPRAEPLDGVSRRRFCKSSRCNQVTHGSPASAKFTENSENSKNKLYS